MLLRRGEHTPGLTNRVREEVYDHVFANDGGEVGGVLVGHSQEGGPAIVTGSIPALEAEGARASVTFTHDAWETVHNTLERDHPGKEIVGWYHSHPGFGIFLSNHDLFIHENFFSDASQVAYVVDPHAGTEGVFGWHDGRIELLHEAKTARPGTRPNHAHQPSDGSPRHGAPRYPRSGLVAALLVGVLLGLVGWLAFKDDGTAHAPRPAAPAGKTATHHRAAHPRQPRSHSDQSERR